MKDRRHDKRRDADGLHSLERWKSAQVDRAQAAHAERQTLVDARTSDVTRVQKSIERSQDETREYLTQAKVLNTDALLMMRHYSTVQAQELNDASALLKESEDEAAAARAELKRKFEELAAVERLRERRQIEAARELARREQKRLDDQAVLRAAADLNNETHAARAAEAFAVNNK